MKLRKKVFFMHPNVHSAEDMARYMKIDAILKNENIELIWDNEKPDYIIATEHIYLNRKYYKLFCNYFIKYEDAIFLYFAGECIAPDFNIFDYAVVFDRMLSDMDRVSRIPPMYFHSPSVFEKTNKMSEEEAETLLKMRDFCCFIYSNANAHPMRDAIFYKLSEYKRVDSLGRHLNNKITGSDRTSGDWRQKSILMKSNYKFSIASENASYEGYTSEKLLTSFQSHSVPIYWGNPWVADEFNENAFINCNKYESLDEVLKRVIEINNNDKLWCHMVSQPWQTESQANKSEEDINNYFKFITHIFKQDIKQARRRPSGTYPSEYAGFYTRGYGFARLERKKILTATKKIPYKIKRILKYVRG